MSIDSREPMTVDGRECSAVEEQVKQLTSLIAEQRQQIEEQKQRIEALEAGRSAPQSNGSKRRHSRRELLRLAGLAAAGAAGAAGASVMSALPAAAITGGSLVMGQQNDANDETMLNPSSAAPNAAADQVLLNVDASVTKGATPNLPVTASTTFFRAIRGKAPTGNLGVGLYGSAEDGTGVAGSSRTGADLWAINSGRIFQGMRPAAAGGPTYFGGAFTTGQWSDAEQVRDWNGVEWLYLPPGLNIAPSSGSPGTWVPVQPGGLNKGLFTAVSTNQFRLTSSDGVTWVDLDNSSPSGVYQPLRFTFTPAFSCQAIISANVDLWTSQAGYNQDIGINITGGAYGTGMIVAWKESGGFAGTFSPNAAFVQTVQPLVQGVSYTIRLQWKTNKSAPGVVILAAAGLGPAFSPTRLIAQLVIDG
jgi:hypothetical protein